MAVKTFTTGEVLTASDTNTYLNNGGLVYVGQTTAGAGVTSVPLDNIFTASYNAYKIIASGGTASTTAVFTLQLLNSSGTPITTGYYETFIYSAYSGATVLAANGNNVSSFQRFGGSISTTGAMGSCDLFNPFLATETTYSSSPRADAAAGNAGLSNGFQSSAVSCRGIKISVSAGTVSGTVLTAYGYRLG